MVGVTERGPVGVPTLVTSYADYRRTFGGYLDPAHYQNGLGQHSFLPHAVEGFFTNGGRRAYVVRVLEEGAAQRARFDLGDRGGAGGGATRLLRGAGESMGAAGLTPADAPAYLLDNTGFADGDRVRVGDGSAAEYRQLDVGGAPAVFHLPFDLPLAHAHDDGVEVRLFALPLPPANVHESLDLDGDTDVAVTRVALVEQGAGGAAAMVAGILLQIGQGEHVEFRRVTDAFPVAGDATRVEVVLDAPLAMPHEAAAEIVTRISLPASAAGSTLNGGVRLGTAVAFVDDANTLTATGDLLGLYVPGDPDDQPVELRRLGALAALPLDVGTTSPLEPGATVQRVDVRQTAARALLTSDAATGSVVLNVDDRRFLAEGSLLEVSGPTATDPSEFAFVLAVPDPGTVASADPDECSSHIPSRAIMPRAPLRRSWPVPRRLESPRRSTRHRRLATPSSASPMGEGSHREISLRSTLAGRQSWSS